MDIYQVMIQVRSMRNVAIHVAQTTWHKRDHTYQFVPSTVDYCTQHPALVGDFTNCTKKTGCIRERDMVSLFFLGKLV